MKMMLRGFVPGSFSTLSLDAVGKDAAASICNCAAGIQMGNSRRNPRTVVKRMMLTTASGIAPSQQKFSVVNVCLIPAVVASLLCFHFTQVGEALRAVAVQRSDTLRDETFGLKVARFVPEEVKLQRVGLAPGLFLEPARAVGQDALGYRPGDFRVVVFAGRGVLPPDFRHDLEPADLAAATAQFVSGT